MLQLILTPMNKRIWVLPLFFISPFSYAQTQNENLNTQLGEMKKYFLAGDYENFANYTYPKIVEMIGGKSKLVQATEQGMTKMKKEGFTFVSLDYKNPAKFLNKDDEIKCTLTQVLVMNTPYGKIESETSLIGISGDQGLNWTFIDTSGKNKETILQQFPNLHEDIVIKPKKQRRIE